MHLKRRVNRKSVDPESKASASQGQSDSEATGGVPSKALTTALPTGKSTRPLGAREGSEMALDTHLCSLVVSERASSAERRLAVVASWSQATVFLASCARKSWERNGKNANEFLPLAD